MESKTLQVSELDWDTPADFPGEADVKVLRHDGARDARTMLVRLGPGGNTAAHAHIAPVQHYIMEGAYESEGQTYGAGTFRLFPSHANIPRITTDSGVTVLMVYDPVR